MHTRNTPAVATKGTIRGKGRFVSLDSGIMRCCIGEPSVFQDPGEYRVTARGMFGMLLEHSDNQRLCRVQPSFHIVRGLYIEIVEAVTPRAQAFTRRVICRINSVWRRDADLKGNGFHDTCTDVLEDLTRRHGTQRLA